MDNIRGRGVGMMRGGSFGMKPSFPTFASALSSMNSLIEEYNDMTSDSLKDLQNKPVNKIGDQLIESLRTRNTKNFSHILCILENEMKVFVQQP